MKESMKKLNENYSNLTVTEKYDMAMSAMEQEEYEFAMEVFENLAYQYINPKIKAIAIQEIIENCIYANDCSNIDQVYDIIFKAIGEYEDADFLYYFGDYILRKTNDKFRRTDTGLLYLEYAKSCGSRQALDDLFLIYNKGLYGVEQNVTQSAEYLTQLLELDKDYENNPFLEEEDIEHEEHDENGPLTISLEEIRRRKNR